MKYNKICHENKLKISSTTDGSSEQLNGSTEKKRPRGMQKRRWCDAIINYARELLTTTAKERSNGWRVSIHPVVVGQGVSGPDQDIKVVNSKEEVNQVVKH